MSVSLIVGVILLIGFIGCSISCGIKVSDMIEEINISSPIEDREPLLGYPGQVWRVIRKHRMLYPQSNRPRSLKRLMLIGFALLAAAGILILGRSFLR
jgi:hypothetical protein